MKKLLLPVLLLVLGASVRAEVVDLREFGRLSFILDPSWRVVSEDFGSSFSIDLVSRENVNAVCEISIAYVPPGEFSTKAQLRSRMIEICEPYARESVERRVTARELFMRAGFGFYSDFTDPALVGKPVERGNFKVRTIAMLRPNDQLGITVTLMSDGVRELGHLQLLSAVESMEILPPAPARK
jgi:hypothetical protein